MLDHECTTCGHQPTPADDAQPELPRRGMIAALRLMVADLLAALRPLYGGVPVRIPAADRAALFQPLLGAVPVQVCGGADPGTQYQVTLIPAQLATQNIAVGTSTGKESGTFVLMPSTSAPVPYNGREPLYAWTVDGTPSTIGVIVYSYNSPSSSHS